MYHTAVVCWNSMLYYINSVLQLFVGFILSLHRFYARFTSKLKMFFYCSFIMETFLDVDLFTVV